MTCMKKIILPLLLASILALSACSNTPSPDATAAATRPITPTATPTPSATPLPDIEFVSLNLLPGRQPGDWRVVGLVENRSIENLIDAHVIVTLLDRSGDPLAATEVPITFRHLGPNESSPVRDDFPGAGLASDAQAELSTFQTGAFQRLQLLVDVLSTASTDRGGMAILATISNTGDSPASIAALALLAQNDRGRALGLANQIAGPAVLRSGETATVLALLEIDAGASIYAPFVDAVAADLMPDPQPVTLAGQANLVLDDQGNPFVVGALGNSGQQPSMGSVTLTLSYQGAWISAAQVNTPVPLGPGEIRPFTAVDFPGLAARLGEDDWSLQDLQIEARTDPLVAGSEAEPYSHLDLSIRSFEAIGGFAFIQGVLTNPYANPVQGASVMAALYDSLGRLVTAGWITASEMLLAGESLDFVLPIPMPAGANPRLYEFDTWAAGVQVAAASGGAD